MAERTNDGGHFVAMALMLRAHLDSMPEAVITCHLNGPVALVAGYRQSIAPPVANEEHYE